MPEHTPELKRILRLAEIEAERDQSGHVGVEHVLVATIQDGRNVGADLFTKQGLTLEDMRSLNFDKKAA